MLFARLEINEFGYIVPDYMGAAQYEGAAYFTGQFQFAKAYVTGNIAVKKVKLIERLKIFHGNGHQRAPIDVLIYSTRAQLDVLTLDPFVVQIVSEEMLTHNPRIVAWLKVGCGKEGFIPMMIVREGVDLTKVDEFFKQAVVFAEQTENTGANGELVVSGQRDNFQSHHYSKSERATTAYPGRMMHIDNSGAFIDGLTARGFFGDVDADLSGRLPRDFGL